jgi:hypothetical protein
MLSSVFGTEEMTSTGEAGVTELPVYIGSAISMSHHEPFGAFLCHLVVLAAGFAVTVAVMFRLVPDFSVFDGLAEIDTVGATISEYKVMWYSVISSYESPRYNPS